MSRRFIFLTITLLIIAGFLFFAYSLAQSKNQDDFVIPQYGDIKKTLGEVEIEPEPEVKKVVHLETPKPLKAIYMTSCVAGTPSLRNNLVGLIEETELNSVIIDIKDYAGSISFELKDPELAELAIRNCFVSDMEEFIEELHNKNIYVIGRVTVFQDPNLAKKKPELAVKRASDGAIWSDRKGLHFTDVGAKEVWDYHIGIAKEAYEIGFDEINFDYIRFPSDGNMKDIYFPHSEGKNKAEALEEFFAYLHKELEPTGIVTSADLFGMTASNFDDLGIGQVLERALPYFDYIAPMVYPSHYPPQFNGWSNPNAVPYEIIKFSMDRAVERTTATSSPISVLGEEKIASTTPQLYTKKAYDKNKMRPWLQDFDYPVPYTSDMVRAQIQATYDAGLDSWMMWDPGNTYTRSVLEPTTEISE